MESDLRKAPKVVVVGGGPVGLIAAIELIRYGLQPVVLEAKSEIAWSSRAICISRRSLEILDRIGAGAAFKAKALPWSRGRTFHRDRLVFKLDMPYAPGDRHAPFVNIQQFYTEQFLLDALRTAAGADIRWSSRVTALHQDADGVTLSVSGPEGAYDLRADWVVAADGGRSTVRDQMGLTMKGTAYESRYLTADIQVEGATRPVERNVWFDSPANPGSTVILHVQPDNVWRIDYQLRDDEDSEEAQREENVRARLQAQLDMMGVRAPWRVVWKSVYKALALSLDEYRHRRVLFAGDAAHLVPIFGVRGLNSGIDDAHNLGWKLAMVARGEAPDALLDSYSYERRRATRENHEQATKSTWFMSPPTPGFQLMRDAVLSLAAEHEWASGLINPRQSSAHVYDDSPIVQPDAAPLDVDVQPGQTLPNAPLQSGGHLQGALPERKFALLLFADVLADPACVSALLGACEACGVPLEPVLIGSEHALGSIPGAQHVRCIIDADGSLAERFAARQFPAYLVRPDEHVAARLPDPSPESLRAACDVALGRRPAARRLEAAVASTALGPGLGQDGLERVFEAISCSSVGGDAKISAFLARLSLLLAERLGDTQAVLSCIVTAREAG